MYELLLIQKKSMKVREYKKKVEHFDNMSKDKSVEEVEEMVEKLIRFLIKIVLEEYWIQSSPIWC